MMLDIKKEKRDLFRRQKTMDIVECCKTSYGRDIAPNGLVYGHTGGTAFDIINRACFALDQTNNPCSRKEAEILLCCVLNCKNSMELYLKNDRIVSAKDLKKFEVMIAQRIQGIPLQYIMKETYFYGLKFFIEEGVFIPRPETESLVEKVIALVKSSFKRTINVFELCTGSGNIAISLTKNIRYCKIFCSDINTAALRLAKRNAEFHDVKEKIDFICSDLFSAVTSGSLKFELIIANPPYVCTRDIRKLPVDVQREPKNALDGGYDGLEFYRKIVEQIPDFIANSGYLAFEFGDGQKVLIKDIIKESGIFEEPVFFSDFNGIFRFVIAKCKNG